jgi:phospholipase C
MKKPCRRGLRGAINPWELSVALFGMILLFAILTGCGGLGPAITTVPPPNQQLNTSINHIIFMAQENRGFDHYFGKLPDYWKANGYPNQTFDGLPANASNLSDDGSTINSFHLRTVCVQNLSPGWNESHVIWNVSNPVSATATLDGFVHTAANFSQNAVPPDAPIFDLEGVRSMGYYDGSDLNFYYFMASNFATSDRWFSPVMSRTQLNRLYLFAATSAGYVNPPKVSLPNKTIFESLESAGVSWKIYETDPGTAFIGNFQPFASQHTANVVPLSQYYTDLTNGTLPSVVLIEPGYKSGLDEHPNQNIQAGAAHVHDIIKALMQSSSWKDSAFILTFDEFGSFYDHVPPQPAVHPDGVPPIDLGANDVCSKVTGPNCDFVYTGYRIPLLVVSPFTKKNYVSHSTADFTAILKLIETRFELPSLTKRDAAQMDMTEFFDFANPPWMTPPNVPDQDQNGVCDFHAVP